MKWTSQILPLLGKEIRLEARNKFAFGGILLYVASTVYLIFYSMQLQHNARDLSPATWNVLLWIVVIFAAVNAVAKSFFQESSGRQLYMYTLADPKAIILSKLLFNQVYMLLLSGLAFMLLILMLGNPVQQTGLFIITLLLASSGFAFIFTLISSIASKANNNATLMAVLGFPLTIPMIVFVSRLAVDCYNPFPSPVFWKTVAMLLALDIILVVLSVILFPYLWRD